MGRWEVDYEFVYIVARGTANPKLMSDAGTDMRASVGALKILPNEPYEIQAELISRYADDRSEGPGATLKSAKLYLMPDDNRTEPTLTIAARAVVETLLVQGGPTSLLHIQILAGGLAS